MSIERKSIRLYEPAQAHKAMAELWMHIKAHMIAGRAMRITLAADTRSLSQNALMWSCLTDLSKQVPWCGKRLTPEGWKDWITGHLEGQELVPNMDGTGFIAIGKGKSTSDMTIKEMTAVIDLCHAFGADKGVKWSRTSLGRDVPDEVAA